MNRYPLFLPSLGRYETRHTSKYLDSMGMFYRLVVEPHEYKKYVAEVDDPKKILVLDMSYKDKYEYCDEYGTDRSTGSGPARNFIWDYSISEGYDRHWIMDDNIRSFQVMTKNHKVRCKSPEFWSLMENFVERYENVAMAGPNYTMFYPHKKYRPPMTFNTRIYSCNLIRNDLPFRWRGRFNEDTILSLDILKAGLCTMQFNTMLQEKMTTQQVKGGNTDSIYKDGTRDKSEMLARVHPDVSEVTWKFNRIHHHVNYKAFAKNKLIKKPDYAERVKNSTVEMRLNKCITL